ncbi:hypothetical protein Q8A67_011859 [Cirrhinus molitorella]|uniref:Uncharacterized protein n=1 Tax=Cirrhinus molitorella TaxID=172907 RepID=A0AA88PR28_9TELE|nr:hypothetical protein Q8A67_011859 [Cirrhinus molitorella]
MKNTDKIKSKGEDKMQLVKALRHIFTPSECYTTENCSVSGDSRSQRERDRETARLRGEKTPKKCLTDYC